MNRQEHWKSFYCCHRTIFPTILQLSLFLPSFTSQCPKKCEVKFNERRWRERKNVVKVKVWLKLKNFVNLQNTWNEKFSLKFFFVVVLDKSERNLGWKSSESQANKTQVVGGPGHYFCWLIQHCHLIYSPSNLQHAESFNFLFSHYNKSENSIHKRVRLHIEVKK